MYMYMYIVYVHVYTHTYIHVQVCQVCVLDCALHTCLHIMHVQCIYKVLVHTHVYVCWNDVHAMYTVHVIVGVDKL